MEITFFRHGYANNSSSSHSLIFMDDVINVNTDEYYSFQWEFFTCANPTAKSNYLLRCLFSSYMSAITPKQNYISISYEQKLAIFKIWLREELPFIMDKPEVKKLFKNIEEKNIDQYDWSVDHQSLISFPMDRQSFGFNLITIHTGFFISFYNEIMKEGYVILGGNDNEECFHPLASKGKKNARTKNMEELRRFLKDQDSRDLLCAFDEKTREYIISNNSRYSYRGSIMKVKF